jgi:hypothetical protein
MKSIVRRVNSCRNRPHLIVRRHGVRPTPLLRVEHRRASDRCIHKPPKRKFNE